MSGRIAKTNNEHQIVTMARDRLNRAYQEMLIELQCKEAQAQVSKKAISKEAKRVMNATSELEVLQVINSPKRTSSSYFQLRLPFIDRLLFWYVPR